MVQKVETNFISKKLFFFLYLRRLPNKDGWLSEDGGGIQFASLISASSRLLAAIVENFARVSGVILFKVENARAACSRAGFLYNRIFYCHFNCNCFIWHEIFRSYSLWIYLNMWTELGWKRSKTGIKTRTILKTRKKRNAKIDKMWTGNENLKN